jgi:Fibronectin type III domain
MGTGVNRPTIKKLNESELPVAKGTNDWSIGDHRMDDHLPLGGICRSVISRWCGKMLAALVLILAVTQFQAWGQNQSVVLVWNPSVDTNVVGYNIYYGTVSGEYTNELVLGDVNTATLTGLTAGTTYYFVATATGADGVESPFSNETTYTVPLPATLALQPVSSAGGVTAVNLTATGAVPSQWMIEESTDLVNWAPVYYGVDSPVNVSFPVTSAPAQFFRLVSN